MRRLVLSLIALAIAGTSVASEVRNQPSLAAASPRTPIARESAANASIAIEVLAPTRRITLAARDLAFASARLRVAGGPREIAATRAFVRPAQATATLVFEHLIPPGRHELALTYRAVQPGAAPPACLAWSDESDEPRVRCGGSPVAQVHDRASERYSMVPSPI